MKQLSIILIHYRTPELLRNCLQSVFGNNSSLEFEILVVDNASGDDAQSRILLEYPQVRWIQMAYNAGFARANNEGISQAIANTVLLLNPDTLDADGAISKCFELFSQSPYVACGLQLLNEDGSPQISGSHFVKGGLNSLLPLPYMGDALKSIAAGFGAKPPAVKEASSENAVDWINGAFLMVKKSAIDLAGKLDEDFFLYSEEIEWCARLRRIGPIALFGQFNLIHLEAGSSNKTFQARGKGYYNLFDRKGGQIMISLLVRIRKQYGKAWFLFMLSCYWIELPFFLICLLFDRLIRGKEAAYVFSEWQGYRRNLIRCTKLTTVILKNQPYFYRFL